MCYYVQIKFKKREVLEMYSLISDHRDDDNDWAGFETTVNGFAHPNLPLLIDDRPGILVMEYSWGLLPEGRNPDFRKNTLNARIETIGSKPSFSNYTENRCCLLVSSYVDWRWEDPSGKKKTKYHIYSAEAPIFALAGIYSNWKDPSGKEWKTFAVCTTKPNSTMEYIHNRRAADNEQRMPVMLRQGDEKAYLDSRNPISDFAYPGYKADLVAFAE